MGGKWGGEWGGLSDFVLFSIFRRAHIEVFAEACAHSLLEGVSAAYGDLHEREVGAGEEVFSSFEPSTSDFICDGAVELLQESSFERTARDAYVFDHVLDGDRFLDIVTNEPYSADQHTVLYEDDIGRLSFDDTDRRNDKRLMGSGPSADHIVEQPSRLMSDALRAGVDTCQLRPGELTEQFVVIDADNGDFLWYAYIGELAGLGHGPAGGIGMSEQADGFGQAGEPLRHFRFDAGVIQPGLERGEFEVMLAGESFLMELLFIAELALSGVVCSGVSAEGERPGSESQQMIRGHLSDLDIIRNDHGHAGGRQHSGDINGGDTCPNQRVVLAFLMKSDDYTIESAEHPAIVAWRRIAELKMYGPVEVFAGIVGDPLYDRPAVSCIERDENRNVSMLVRHVRFRSRQGMQLLVVSIFRWIKYDTIFTDLCKPPYIPASRILSGKGDERRRNDKVILSIFTPGRPLFTRRNFVIFKLSGILYLFRTGSLILIMIAASAASGQDIGHAFTYAESQLGDAVVEINNDATRHPRRTYFGSGDWETFGHGDWTSGFWSGCLWKMYERTGVSNWRQEAEKWTADILPEQYRTGDHDTGFIIMSSFGNGYRLTGRADYKPVILTAANSLSTRFNPTVGCIKSWEMHTYPVCIDNMMNLELLFWASKNGGGQHLYDMAVSHADKTIDNHVRVNGSTYHVVDYNLDGTVRAKFTGQGATNESTWSRGQAWGLYGFTMTYRETGLQRFLDTAVSLADYFVDHLPVQSNPGDDYIPYSDFDYPVKKDASAGAIACAGLIELDQYVTTDKYRIAAAHILEDLTGSGYLTEGKSNPVYSSILSRATERYGDDERGLIYADYYLLEAMLRYGTVPEPPSNVTATAVSSSEIHLTWQDNSDDETSFIIQRKPCQGDNNWSTVGEVDPGVTTYTDTQSIHGYVQYTYRIGADKQD